MKVEWKDHVDKMPYKMKPNCLTRALDQWNEDKSMRLWYNGNHVVSIERFFMINALEGKEYSYLPVESYGTYHFITSYQLSKKYLKLLGEYCDYQSENVKIV